MKNPGCYLYSVVNMTSHGLLPFTVESSKDRKADWTQLWWQPLWHSAVLSERAVNIKWDNAKLSFKGQTFFLRRKEKYYCFI